MQDYDPCEHGMDSDCCACEIATLRRQAQADEEEIVQLQGWMIGVLRGCTIATAEAARYCAARGLL